MKKSIETLLSILLFASLAVGGLTTVVRAESRQEELREEELSDQLRPYAKISPEQAKQAARSILNDEVEDVELDANRNRTLYYEVESATTIVYVDAGNGRVLGSEPVDEDAVEDALQGSITVPIDIELDFD